MFIHLSLHSFIFSFILLSIQIIVPYPSINLFINIENQKSSSVSLQHGEPRLDFTGDNDDNDDDISIISIYSFDYLYIYLFIYLSILRCLEASSSREL